MVHAQEAKNVIPKGKIEEASDSSQKRCVLKAQEAIQNPSTVCMCWYRSECSGLFQNKRIYLLSRELVREEEQLRRKELFG